MWKKAYSGSFKGIVLGLVSLALAVLALYFIVSRLPAENQLNVIFVVSAILFAFFLLASICSERTDKKETESSKPLSYYNEKYAKYVKVVQAAAQRYSEKMPTNGWTKTLSECVYAVWSECDYRHFTDFDMAACLMFAITKHKNDNKALSFAYYCVKCAMPRPRKYLRAIERDGEIFLNLGSSTQCGKFPETTKEIMVLLRGYIDKIENACDLLALSDFLRILFITGFSS